MPSDPLIIKKHWLKERKRILKDKLGSNMQQTSDICKEIEKRRAFMQKHITTMENIKNTHLKEIL